ncbi:hypothetical protein HY772_07685 [Candidatus Woesearchaeota archaeon]|nr:hypothetical protein [Candidatus Woesearchaeota archaeon]
MWMFINSFNVCESFLKRIGVRALSGISLSAAAAPLSVLRSLWRYRQYAGGAIKGFAVDPFSAALSRISLALGRCTARCECAGHIIAERMLKQPVYRFSSQGGSGRFGTEPFSAKHL